MVRKMRGIMTLLQQKAIMYLSSCYINSLPAVLQWQPQTGRKVAIRREPDRIERPPLVRRRPDSFSPGRPFHTHRARTGGHARLDLP